MDDVLERFRIFRPDMPYDYFWNKLFLNFQNGRGETSSDLKKEIDGFANTAAEYRE
jgi:hypothetical protein